MMITSCRRIALGVISLALIGLAGCVPQPPEANSPKPSPAEEQSAAAAPAHESLAPVVLVPGGQFLMGGTGDVDAQPVHRVTVSPFYMDRQEVTQELYERLLGVNPSRRKGPQNPVERVRWTDALKFCNARSTAESLTPCYDLKARTCDFAADGYRLPTEAEWEYACRGGTTGDTYFESSAEKLDDHAWHAGNARRTHHPVGQKRSNPFGLYDMLGNVREWCQDWYAVDYYQQSPATDPRGPATGEKVVLRGGAFSGTADSCTTWARFCDEPGFTDACVASDDYGFRCVRKAKPEEGTP